MCAPGPEVHVAPVSGGRQHEEPRMLDAGLSYGRERGGKEGQRREDPAACWGRRY